MEGAHIDGQARAVKAHRDEDAALGRLARLAAHPARLHRVGRPDHQHGLGDLELRGRSGASKSCPVVDLRIPPDRPALRLDRGDQRRDARLVAAGVGNEDVGHARVQPLQSGSAGCLRRNSLTRRGEGRDCGDIFQGPAGLALDQSMSKQPSANDHRSSLSETSPRPLLTSLETGSGLDWARAEIRLVRPVMRSQEQKMRSNTDLLPRTVLVFLLGALAAGVASGAPGDTTVAHRGGGTQPRALSGDGRYLAFSSANSTFVPGDTNDTEDVFIKDLQSGLVQRVSVNSQAVQGNRQSDSPAISHDGRFVAFRSLASNLVPNDRNGRRIYSSVIASSASLRESVSRRRVGKKRGMR